MIYDYKCLSCNKGFQVDRPMKSRIVSGKHSGVRCPKCKSRKVRKVIHKAEIVFKGSGFYATDKDKK